MPEFSCLSAMEGFREILGEFVLMQSELLPSHSEQRRTLYSESVMLLPGFFMFPPSISCDIREAEWLVLIFCCKTDAKAVSGQHCWTIPTVS